MATPEALIKYYDCLKDSFNKIQVKDNKAALINAALRPKIHEELSKSRGVLISYLNYIKVFTPIYRDKFGNICFSIICPLFREISPRSEDSISYQDADKEDDSIISILHKSIGDILRSEPELSEEYILCLVKAFPNPYNDDRSTFINFLDNCLLVCSYVRGETLTTLFAKILDRINPPTSSDQNDEEKLAYCKQAINCAYESIYKLLRSENQKQLENVSAAILAAFSREFLISENGDSLNYLILYICSLDSKLSDLFINLLWTIFSNPQRPFIERRASVYYACSFMSRANYVGLEQVLSYVETAVGWCNHFLSQDKTIASRSTESSQLFFSLVDSILYLLTQRYRELYEKESIERIRSLELDKILNNQMKPLEACGTETEQRFRELATLYDILSLEPFDEFRASRKRRKSDQTQHSHHGRKYPFKETDTSVPDHVKHLYRCYYDHRNFTIYRE